MTIAEAVRTYVLTLTPVTALVNQRIWTYRFEQKPTLPAIRIAQVSELQSGHLRGTTNLRWARIQIDVIATKVKDAREVDQALQGAYANGAPTGLLGIDTWVGSPAVRIIVPKTLGYLEPDWEADELRLSRVTRDYQVWVDGLI